MSSSPPQTITDPHNISAILFHKKTDAPHPVEPYVGPIQVVLDPSSVAHGRGVVATRDIAAGELLIVTPPTVDASLAEVHRKWCDQLADSPDACSLEKCAEETLVDAMEEACRDNPAISASFAVLTGGGKQEDPPATTMAPPIHVLLGQGDGSMEFQPEQLTRENLLGIIRANAFGPDGLHSYAHVEDLWRGDSADTDKATHESILQQNPRLLGIYPLAAMLNHSCLANAVRVYAGNVMLVHALHDIARGAEIVWSYVPPSQPHRRPILESQYGFVCQCDRCVAEGPVLSAWETRNPTEWQHWNQRRLTDFPSYAQLHKAVNGFEQSLVEMTSASNQVRRYVRIGYLHFYIHYFNVALANLLNETDPLVAHVLRTELLALATQLHFCFCAAHNASTEHLSILHLCYELVGQLHTQATDPSQTLPKVRFWTEQLKKAHMTRYGSLGQDVDNVRRVMQHSRLVLRQRDGWQRAAYFFL